MTRRELEWDGRDWIELAQDRDQWRALANTVMSLWIPKNCWEFSEWLHNWQLLRKGSAPYVSCNLLSSLQFIFKNSLHFSRVLFASSPGLWMSSVAHPGLLLIYLFIIFFWS
jgi:hypothetical protein